MVYVEIFDSAAEWRRSLSRSISFYNEIFDFMGHCVKTISFCNELCVSKHPSFYGVSARAQHIVNYNGLFKKTPKELCFSKKQQFLQWFMHPSKSSQKCIKQT